MADHCSEDVRRHDGRGRAAAEIDSSLRRHQQLIGCNAYWRKQMSTMKGSYNPEDPLFDLDSDTVKAKVVP